MPFLDLDLNLGLNLSFKNKDMVWTPQQLDVLDEPSPQIILSGGYGSGKTLIGLYKFLMVLKSTSGKGIVTGFSYNTLKKLIIQTLDELNVRFSFNKQNSEIKSEYGAFYLYGMDTVRSKSRIRSLNLSCWYADEVTLQDQEACLEVMARLRSVDNPSWIWSTNPDSPSHWCYKYLKKKGVVHYSFKTTDNPHLPADYIKNLNLDENSNDYKRMVLGEWVSPDAMPFKNLYYSDEEMRGEIIAVIDPSLEGKDYTALCMGSMVAGQLVVHGELYKEDYSNVLFNQDFLYFLKKCAYIYYESNIAGSIFADLLYTRAGLRSEGFRTTQNKDKKIRAVVSFVNKGFVKFDNACSRDFLAQILNYGLDAHDDAPDSLAMLINKMQEFSYF